MKARPRTIRTPLRAKAPASSVPFPAHRSSRSRSGWARSSSCSHWCSESGSSFPVSDLRRGRFSALRRGSSRRPRLKRFQDLQSILNGTMSHANRVRHAGCFSIPSENSSPVTQRHGRTTVSRREIQGPAVFWLGRGGGDATAPQRSCRSRTMSKLSPEETDASAREDATGVA